MNSNANYFVFKVKLSTDGYCLTNIIIFNYNNKLTWE